MAMSANLFLATDDDIKKLKAKPTSINNFTGGGGFMTYNFTSINFFVYGDAWKGDALFGLDTVDCSTLEGGNFGIVKPAQVAKVLAKLEKVDLKKLKKAVDEADPEEMDEEECYDFELLLEHADEEKPSEAIVNDVKGLIAFYKRAAKKQAGVVMYTT